MPRQVKPDIRTFGGVLYVNSTYAAKQFGTTSDYLRHLVMRGKLERYRMPGVRMMNYFAYDELEGYFGIRGVVHEPERQIETDYAANI